MTQEAGPSSVLDAVKAFKDAQEQRVNHWREYDEALALYQSSSQQTPPLASRGAHVDGANPGGSHYRSEPLPMTDDIFAKVLSLVTSGLLDSSHSVRAVETELRSRFKQERLASLVGQVQDAENAVLRCIVQRDQEWRRADVQGRDHSGGSGQQDAAVQTHRQQIQDLMDEINAEVAEMDEA